ncbi:MAG: HAD-IA family hydrolase [Candidatus Aenigmarchaeota archaeon]|nr:HAD-IA family hydrolase [Candidatus Aenigmarchaeota archaeon]
MVPSWVPERIADALYDIESRNIGYDSLGGAMENPAFRKFSKAYSKFSLRREAEPVLKELKERGYRLGLISNTHTSAPKEVLEESGLSEYFDAELYSNEEGIEKPESELFVRAAKRIGCEPENCAYVGNSKPLDYDGSLNAGYSKAVLVSGKHGIKNLRELLEIFD